jgi:hypothetical protein
MSEVDVGTKRWREATMEDCAKACDLDFAGPVRDEALSYETIRFLWMAQLGCCAVRWEALSCRYLDRRDDDGRWDPRFQSYCLKSSMYSPCQERPGRAVQGWVDACTRAYVYEDEVVLPTLQEILEEQGRTLAIFEADVDRQIDMRDASVECEWCGDCGSVEYPSEGDGVRRRISWGLPTVEFLEKAGGFVGAEGFLLGVGSGHGYLEFCIGMQSGARVRCTDAYTSPRETLTPWILLGPVEHLDGDAALAKYGADASVLMLAFPTGGYWETRGPRALDDEESWTSRVVRVWREEHHGRKLLLVDQVPDADYATLGGPSLRVELGCWVEAERVQLTFAGMDTEIWASLYMMS